MWPGGVLVLSHGFVNQKLIAVGDFAMVLGQHVLHVSDIYCRRLLIEQSDLGQFQPCYAMLVVPPIVPPAHAMPIQSCIMGFHNMALLNPLMSNVLEVAGPPLMVLLRYDDHEPHACGSVLNGCCHPARCCLGTCCNHL